MHETPSELAALQALLEHSYAAAGPHMADIVADEHRLTAAGLCERLQGLCLMVTATTTSDGRPRSAPVDAYFLHGAFYFSVGEQSLRARHLARSPHISATHLPGIDLCVTVHGRAAAVDLAGSGLRQAVLAHYVPLQGPQFEEWLDESDALAFRIDADRLIAAGGF